MRRLVYQICTEDQRTSCQPSSPNHPSTYPCAYLSVHLSVPAPSTPPPIHPPTHPPSVHPELIQHSPLPCMHCQAGSSSNLLMETNAILWNFHFYLHCHHLVPNHPLTPVPGWSSTHSPHGRPSSPYFKTGNAITPFNVDHVSVGPQSTENKVTLLRGWGGLQQPASLSPASCPMTCWNTSPLNDHAQPQRSSGPPADRRIPAWRPFPMLLPWPAPHPPTNTPPAICKASSFSDITHLTVVFSHQPIRSPSQVPSPIYLLSQFDFQLCM